MSIQTLTEERQALITQAQAILADPESDHEKVAQAKKMYADVVKLGEKIALMQDLKSAGEVKNAVEDASQEIKRRAKDEMPKGFSSKLEYLRAIAVAGSSKHGFYRDPRLLEFNDSNEPGTPAVGQDGYRGWENKALSESTGAAGGFLVIPEYSEELMAVRPDMQPIAARAQVMNMASRSLNIPVLDQTGTTAGQPAWFGGLIAYWNAEAALKTESSPTFRQLELVAHKLICYTRASDELVSDTGVVSLDDWLRSDLGFAGAIRWHSEYAYLRGTGAGQPRGVITAVNTPTLVQARAGAGLAVADFTGMLEQHFGPDPVWHISKSQYSNLLQLNGPAGNPSYIFIPNGRDGAPATLFGFPIIWDDKLPAAGTQGDVLLASWNYYVIGRRQEVTFRSTDIERFQYDQTSFRAVARLDGQPWLQSPITYSDGTTQVSPFVILGAASAS